MHIRRIRSTPWRSLALVTAVILALVEAVFASSKLSGPLPTLPWLLSLPLCILAFPDLRDAGWKRRDQLIILGLLVVGLISRLALLDRWPSFINPDEPIFGLLSLDLLDGKSSPFVRGWFGEPYVSLVPFSVGIQLLGQNMLALRIPSGIIGGLGIPALYVTGKEAFGRVVGLFSALFLLVSVPAFHISRTGLSNIQAVTVITVGAGALLMALHNPKRQRQWAVLGLMLGLTFCTFSSSLVLIPIAGISLLPFLPRIFRDSRLFALSAVPLLTCFLIGAAPILTYVAGSPADLSGHALSMVVWNKEARDHETYSYHLKAGDTAGLWRIQIERSLGGLITNGDTQADYGSERGLLDPVAAVTLILGLAVLLRQWRRPSTLLLVSWIALTLVLGSIIIEDPPQTTKLVVLVPATCIVSALGLERVLAMFAAGSRRDLLVLAVGVASIVAGGAIGFSYYFGHYQLVPGEAATVLSRYARSVEDSRSIYLVDLNIPPTYEMLRYLAPRAKVSSWDTTKAAPAIPVNGPLAFVMPLNGDSSKPALEAVRNRYPIGKERLLLDLNGRSVLRVWEVTETAGPSG